MPFFFGRESTLLPLPNVLFLDLNAFCDAKVPFCFGNRRRYLIFAEKVPFCFGNRRQILYFCRESALFAASGWKKCFCFFKRKNCPICRISNRQSYVLRKQRQIPQSQAGLFFSSHGWMHLASKGLTANLVVRQPNSERARGTYFYLL